MSVQRSPFSRQTAAPTAGYGFDEDGNPIYVKANGEVIALSGRQLGASGKPKTTFAQEQSALERETKQAVSAIGANRALNSIERLKATADAESIAQGGTQKTSSYGPLGNLLKSVVAAPAKALGAAFKAYDTAVSPFMQVGNSAIQELGDGLGLLRGNETDRRGVKRTFSWEDFVRQSKTKDFNVFKTGGNLLENKVANSIAAFSMDALFDPTTYVTLPVSATSKSTRFALANTMLLKTSKYPELKPLLGNIARYGPVAIPAHIREAENIFSGIKYFGREVPYSSGLAKAWRYSFGAARAKTGDLMGSTALGRHILEKTAPESMRGLVTKGLGRKASMNVYDKAIAQEFMEQSASRWAKGVYSTQLSYNVAGISQVIENARTLSEIDPTMASVYKVIENPTLAPTVSDNAASVAEEYKIWADDLYEQVTKAQKRLGDDYGLVVREMGYIEDHLFHRITPEAREWMLDEGKSGVYGYGRSTELTARDLLEGGGTLSYRKYRKPVIAEDGTILDQQEFLGEKIFHGTIEEMNEISMRKIGVKWFEDDLGIVAQAYAESIARAMSRIAYVDRAMAFGPDTIMPLLGKVIKDEGLVKSLTIATAKLTDSQTVLKRRVKAVVGAAGTREAVAKGTDEVLSLAQSVLDGKFFDAVLTESELSQVKTSLNQVFQTLEDAREASLSLSKEQRGEFNDVWGGLLREAETYRSALDSNNALREIALKDLRQEYIRLMGDGVDASEMNGRSAEWFAERIIRSRGGGRSVAREQVRLAKRQDYLRKTLDELPEEDFASREVIEGQLVDIDAQLEGAQYLSQAKEQASYAGEGVIFGSVSMPDEGPVPFQMFTTKAIDDEFGTFSSMPDSIMGFAIPENELVDFRDAENLLTLIEPENIADSVNRAWREAGIEDATWSSVVADAFAKGQVDELYEQVSPAKSALLQGLIDFDNIVRQKALDGEDMSINELQDFFGWFENVNKAVAHEVSPDNSDIVGTQIFNDWLRSSINDAGDSGYRGVLVPLRNMAPDMDGVGNEWAVLLPSDSPPPVVGGSYSDEWQLVADNPLAEQAMRGSMESYELDLLAKGDALKQQGLDTMAVAEARKGLEDELSTLIPDPIVERINQLKGSDSVVINGVDVPVKRARKELAKADNFIAKQYDNIDKQVRRVVDETYGTEDALNAQRLTYEERLPMLLDNAQTLVNWDTTTGQLLRQEIQDMTMLLSAKPAKGSTAASNAAWVRDVKRVMSNSSLLNDIPEVKEAFERVMTMVFADEAALAKVTSELSETAFKLSEAEAGIIGKYVYDTAEKGWKELKGLGVQVPNEVAQMWEPNLKKLYDAAEAGPFFKMMDAFNAQWKKRVTASVGFFVRNGLSAQVMNYADGVSNAHIAEGLRWAIAQHDSLRRTRNDINYRGWMDRAKITDPDAIAEAELIEKIVAAGGRGVSDDMALPSVGLAGPQGNIIRRADNGYLKFFARKNDFVERAVRIPMAIDSVRKGMSFDEAVARISRVHFDYSDLSKVDEKMKRYVPFWIWTSRNIPLQVGQIIQRPKVYYEYERIRQEFPTNSEQYIPKWIADQGPLGVAAGMVLTPDLPWTKLQKNMMDIANPVKLLGQASPVIKVPVETWLAKRQLGIDVGPFGADKATSGYVDGVVARLMEDLTGSWMTSRDKKGNLLMDPRVIYTIEQALPPLAQAFRLSGGKLGGKDTLEERWRSSIFNWFGVPIREIGPDQQRGEVIRRRYAQKDLLKDLEQISGQKIGNPEPPTP
jgi:hypothetical protein